MSNPPSIVLNSTIMSIGTVLIGVMVTGGFIAGLLTGKSTDGLNAAFFSIMTLFVGGGIYHVGSQTTMQRTTDLIKTAIETHAVSANMEKSSNVTS